MISTKPNWSAWPQQRVNRILLLGLVALGTVDCDRGVECAAGEVRFSGRPPARVFAFDSSCNSDCFSNPQNACDNDCGEVAADSSKDSTLGYLYGNNGVRDDRVMALVDRHHFGDGRALVFEFGSLDELGDPAMISTWGFLAGGKQSYLANQVSGVERFFMRAAVAVDSDSDGIYELDSNSSEASDAGSEVVDAHPGRLDILHTAGDRLIGKFFLGFSSLIKQPQGEVEGCFDVAVSPATPGVLRRDLIR